jgi:nucleoside-diphosphate-sugar epimerase
MKTFTSSIVIGSSGFIGAHLCRTLEERGVKEIHRVDIKATPSIDIRKPFDIEGDFGENAVIFNLAAVHRTPGHSDREYFETNMPGAENVCRFAKKRGIKTIVFASSISPYGAGEEKKTEKTLPTPNTPYGISKFLCGVVRRFWAWGLPRACSEAHSLD